MVAAGSKFYPGAARLASEAALRGGAGLVVLAAPESIQALLAAGTPEVTHHPLPGADGATDASSAAELLRALSGCDALLPGPGLARRPGGQLVDRYGVLPEVHPLPVTSYVR